MLPLGHGFLVLWIEGVPVQNEIRGMRLDGNGVPRDPESFVIVSSQETNGYGDAQVLCAASDGSSAFLVSEPHPYDAYYTAAPFRLDRVDADGTVTNLSMNFQLAARYAVMAAAAGTLTIFTEDESHLSVTQFDEAGTLLHSTVPVVHRYTYPSSVDVEPAGDTFLLAWVGDDERLRLRTILPSDIASSSVPLIFDDDAFIEGRAASSPRLAADATHGAVVWIENGSLWLEQFSGLSGVVLADGQAVGNFRPLSEPTIVMRSDGYLIAFLDAAPDGSMQLTTVHVAFDGTLQETSHLPAGFATYPRLLSFAGNGEPAVAAWIEQRYLPAGGNFFGPKSAGFVVVAAPVSDHGPGAAVVLSTGIPIQHARKLLPAEGVVAGVWTEAAPNERLVAGRFALDGPPLDGAGLRLRDSVNDQQNIAVATNGGQLFVVWTEWNHYPRGQTLYGALVFLTGALSAKVQVLATDASGGSDNAVEWNGTSFTVVYQRQSTLELAALRVNAGGDVIDPAPIRLTPPRPPYYSSDDSPRLSWNGSEYLLLWIQSLPYGGVVNQLAAQRLDLSLSAIGGSIDLANNTLNGSPPYFATSPGVALSDGDWLVAWSGRPPGGDSVTQTLFARVSRPAIVSTPRTAPSASSTDHCSRQVQEGGRWPVAPDRCGWPESLRTAGC